MGAHHLAELFDFALGFGRGVARSQLLRNRLHTHATALVMSSHNDQASSRSVAWLCMWLRLRLWLSVRSVGARQPGGRWR